jgi:magnesium transporter
LNTRQRPKIEAYDDYLHTVIKMLDYETETGEITTEQVSLVLKNNILLTFQERPGDVLDPIRERLQKGLGRIRKSGTDYLAYAIVDAIVDRYFYILEIMGERLEILEEAVLEDPSKEIVNEIYSIKRQLLTLRHAVWPLREQVNSLRKGESPFIQEGTLIFLSDLHDHIMQVIDTVENYREMVAGLLDLYLSSLSNRMNEVMRILTVIATIFIPLTFIAGIYGMNFHFMPELSWKWAYPLCWLAMIGIGAGMVMWFRRKKWL